MQVWEQDLRASFGALDTENWEEAIAAAERAIFTFPDYVEPDSPYIAKARAHARLEDKENEFLALETFWKRGGYAPRALLALGEDYRARGESEAALEVLQDVIWSDPFMEEVHLQLGDLYLETGNAPKALREYEVLLALDPIDKAQANLKLATAYRALGDGEHTMEYLMTALDLAPQYRPAQQLLLELTRESAAEKQVAPN
jgi:tetratricopeptide (TPR) repeat protein